MATSVVPALIDALVAQAPAAVGSSVIVYDGFGISEDPSDYVMVGVDDPDLRSAGASASADQEQIATGLYRESGTFTCAAYSFNGDAIQKNARDAVFGVRDSLDALIRSTRVSGPTSSVLGVVGVTNVVATSWALRQDVWQSADALLVFSFRFEANI